MGAIVGPDIPSSGLVFHVDALNRRSYPGTGSTWTDLVSGTAGSMTDVIFDSAENAMSFNGTSSVVNFGNPTSLLLSTQQTIVMYFKQTVALSGHIFGKGATTAYRVRTTNLGAINYLVNNVSNQGANGMAPLSTWVCCTAVGGPSGLRIYINDTLRLTNGTAFAPSNPSGTTYIGNNGAVDWFNGSVSVVSVYDRAFSEDEVRANFNAFRSRYGI